MKDFLGKDLAVGDYVVMMLPRYREYCLAKVIAFTAKKIRVEYTNPSYRHRGLESMLQEEHQLVKVDEADAMWMKLTGTHA
jgi:hypothetical protein